MNDTALRTDEMDTTANAMWMVTSVWHVAAAAAFVTILSRIVRRSTKKNMNLAPLPPGPKPLPILGNLLDMPNGRIWETFAKWGEEYGDIVHAGVFGKNLIFISSAKAASDIIEKRSLNYADRPPLALLSVISKLDWDFGFLPHGETWRQQRRLFMSKFGITHVSAYQPIHMQVVPRLLKRLKATPMDAFKHYRLHAVQDIQMIIYGLNVESNDDPSIKAAEDVAYMVVETVSPEAQVFDVLPILRYFPYGWPGAHILRNIARYRDILDKYRMVPYKAVKDAMVDNTHKPCFVSDILEEKNDVDEETLVNCAAVAYLAGSDTNVISLESFTTAMILYPETQKKAQMELDSVVGTDRLPTFADRDNLPYVAAVFYEALRWHTVAPMGVPHRNMEEDMYKGYRIPAHSTIFMNLWAICHDPETFPDPFTFNPERFMGDKEAVKAKIALVRYVFGRGRRICAGMWLAEDLLWVTIANILATLNIGPEMDANGQPIPVEHIYMPQMLSHVEPFPLSMKPRSEKAAALIDHEEALVRANL